MCLFHGQNSCDEFKNGLFEFYCKHEWNLVNQVWCTIGDDHKFRVHLVRALCCSAVLLCFLQVCLAVLAIVRLRRGIIMGNDASVPPMPNDSSALPPTYAASVYDNDSPFSPHPFTAKPGEYFPATTEQPAY